jgi:hypothetical protein
MKAGIPRFVGLAVLLVLAGPTAPLAHARCTKDCRKQIGSEFKACKTACGKDKVCKDACRGEKKADAVTCKTATNPTPPDCGRTTTTTSATMTTTTTPRCHFEAATNDCKGGCPLTGQQCTLVASNQCDCLQPSCHTCWITVDDFCTSIPCSTSSDCTQEPNLLCLPDKCEVPCPTSSTTTTALVSG